MSKKEWEEAIIEFNNQGASDTFDTLISDKVLIEVTLKRGDWEEVA